MEDTRLVMSTTSKYIELKRNTKANIPVLREAEPFWATDECRLYVGDGTINYPIGGTGVQIVCTTDTTSLIAATATINTTGKYAGRMVWDDTAKKPCWAVGASATDNWVDGAGFTITPV